MARVEVPGKDAKMRRLLPYICIFLLVAGAGTAAAQLEKEEEPPSPYADLNSLYIRVEGMPAGSNFTLDDIYKRVRRLFKAELPDIELVEEEGMGNGIFRVVFPDNEASGSVLFETLVYKIDPATGEADLASAWEQKVPYSDTMRKFFFFSDVLNENVDAFIEDYKRHEEKAKAGLMDRKKPALTKDRLEYLGAPR